MEVTEHQLHLLHHTLGVNPKRREPYRNYFVASEGHHDFSDLAALESIGYMARSRTPSFCDADTIVFGVTEAGRAYALDNLPQPPKRTKYGQYLDADCFDSFADFLGINVPEVEWNHQWGAKCLYRFVRYSQENFWRRRPDVTGEWKPTKKEAKASYKAELKKKLARDREIFNSAESLAAP